MGWLNCSVFSERPNPLYGRRHIFTVMTLMLIGRALPTSKTFGGRLQRPASPDAVHPWSHRTIARKWRAAHKRSPMQRTGRCRKAKQRDASALPADGIGHREKSSKA
jgi:hypothetical protein